MKGVLMLLLMGCLSINSYSQTWSEWFRQKKTKIKYLTEQIVVLKVYGDYAYKGYSIVKKELANITDTKTGDLVMHSDQLASLRSVNPAIKNYSKIGQVITLQENILTLYRKQKKAIESNDELTDRDVAHVRKVLTGLVAGCADVMEELITITTTATAAMRDEERLRRIDSLYECMQERYVFIKSFGVETSVLSLQRLQKVRDIKTSRTLSGVH